MKKTFTIFVMTLIVMATVIAVPVQKSLRADRLSVKREAQKTEMKAKKQTSKKKYVLDASKIVKTVSPQTKATAATETIISEDFSKFTLGTEAAPDATDISDPSTSEIPANYTQTPGFYGAGVHQAGGICSLQLYDDVDEAGQPIQETGFIMLPESDLSGNAGTFTVQFRARTTGSSGDTFAVLWVDTETDDYNGQEVQLTNAWQDFTVTFENTGSKSMAIQVYSYTELCMIDDIKIIQNKSSIAAPEALYPTNVTPTGFTANWTSISDATAYLLNVYSYKTGESVQPATTVTEGFDQITVDATSKGKNIDLTNPNYPANWTIDVATNGTSRHIYTSKGNFSSEGISLAFDATGDNLITPVMTAPASAFSFWVKDQPGTGVSTSTISVQAFNGSAWSEIATVIASELSATGEILDLSDIIPAGTVQFKLTFDKKVGNVAIDDVSYTYGGATRTKEYLLTDQRVTENSKDVAGTIEGTTYYYTVKAVNDQFTSIESNEMEVAEQMTGLPAPIVLPATNVSSTGFMANWQPVAKADAYAIYVSLKHTAATDEIFNLTDEGFDGSTEGTIEAPVEGEDLVEYLDGYTKYPDWQAVMGMYAEGMVGFSNDLAELGLPGTLYSPTLDLSNNNGKFDVTLSMVGGAANDVVSVICFDMNDESAMEVKDITLTGNGPQTTTVSFEQGKAGSYIAIGTTGAQLFIDNVKISQALKAGESTAVNCFYDESETNSCPVDGLENTSMNSFSYKVLAFAVTPEDEIIQSDFSEPMDVLLDAAGLSSTEENGIRIFVTGETMHINLKQNATIEIYNTTGQLLKQINGTIGENTITLPTGSLYLVNTSGKCVKVKM